MLEIKILYYGFYYFYKTIYFCTKKINIDLMTNSILMRPNKMDPNLTKT